MTNRLQKVIGLLLLLVLFVDFIIISRNLESSLSDVVEENTTSLGIRCSSHHEEDSTAEEEEANPVVPSPWIAVFYNIFVPSTERKRDLMLHATGIIEEQLGQIHDSDAAQLMASNNHTLMVYYNTIGLNRTFERVEEFCATKANISCVHMNHFAEGHEEVTLNELHQYCLDPTTPSHARVVYLHNKGSFHKVLIGAGSQDLWRRYLTTAATHRDCVHPPNDTCNYCGLHISMIPSIQQTGNMWSAQCAYVRKLLSPLDYGQCNQDVAKQFLTLTRKGMHPQAFGYMGDVAFGLDRYSNEHWAGSHPSVVPCDLNPMTLQKYWLQDHSQEEAATNSSATDKLEFHMLPRRPLQDPDLKDDNVFKSLNNTEELIHDFYFLSGLLLRWLMLYQQVPADNSSWLYETFPNATFWKQAIQTHGIHVLDVIYNTTIPVCKNYPGCGGIGRKAPPRAW